MRILSVDDSKATRRFIKNAIDILGFDFLEAGDGQEGLEVLEKESGNVDLILLDWNMPVMDGLEMLQKVKANDLFKDITVTMVTTEMDREMVVEAIGKGAKNYLIKPFTQEELIGKVMEGLGMSL